MKKRLAAFAAMLALCACAAAEPDQGIRFSEGFLSYQGSVTVYWEDDADAGPYTLTYQCAEDTLDPQAVFIEEEIPGVSCTLEYLAPGCSYTLWVENGRGDCAETLISLPEPQPFADGKLTAKPIGLRALPGCAPADWQSEKEVSRDVRLDSGEMGETIADTAYGVHIGISYPELAHDRTLKTMLVFRAPGGYTRVYDLGRVAFSRHKVSSTYLYWPLVGSEFFDDLYRLLGAIPSGRYTVTCYLDGMTAAETGFNVY